MSQVFIIPLHDHDDEVVAHTFVDIADRALGEYRWCLDGVGYAIRSGGIRLHRAVLGLVAGDGLEGDHINQDTLDNRRSNLRVVTHAQNQQNMSSHRDSTSRHRGVSWDGRRGKWRADAYVGGRQHALGRFDDELEAAQAASNFRAEYMPFAVEV